MSPTQCWAQACGQPSRCRRSPASVVAEALLEALRRAGPSRVFVSVTEKLQCGSPVQAIDVAAQRG